MRLRADKISWAVRGKPLLADVTLDAAPGSLVGLLGPNGSGKSSLLRVLAGLQRPDSGRVLLDGVDAVTISRRTLARTLALVTQQSATDVDMSVRDVLLLARIPHRPLLAGTSADDLARAEQALEAAGLPGFADRQWSSLSGGERQRVDIARALAQEPRLLLLDEPTNHLDIRHQLDLLDQLSRSPVTVVTALHDLNLAARFCTAIVLLHAGRVVAAGPPAQVLTPDRIAEVYQVAAEVTADPDGCPYVHLRRADSRPQLDEHPRPVK
ncbi:ABC transporter ATP-binding protein [Solwaraspora sp. WMMD406]|uniref:ABC transporter ATP-binding protein n=1 Tax=Solwaraspora sp. WMMD406 TaxID=3016095 RepID=UPI0024160C49|nr:ABC transporter ATP-binding protein [Solwaraspora sp. WMMD406]MDG4763437.1 ABC transporter ATP-binding protein [Solwaraspora sp. WMMD406]